MPLQKFKVLQLKNNMTFDNVTLDLQVYINGFILYKNSSVKLLLSPFNRLRNSPRIKACRSQNVNVDNLPRDLDPWSLFSTTSHTIPFCLKINHMHVKSSQPQLIDVGDFKVRYRTLEHWEIE